MRCRFTSTALLALSMALGCATPAVARAGPVIAWPDEEAGAPVREAARALLLAIADGDAARARRHFAGPADHAELLEARLRLAASFEAFREALVDQFGVEGMWPAFWAPDLARDYADAVRTKPVLVNGDVASIANGTQYDQGLALRRVGDVWRVTHLVVGTVPVDKTRALMTAVAEATDAVRPKVLAGEVKDARAAMGMVEQRVLPAYQASRRPWPALAEPSVPAAPAAPRSAAELQALLGQPIKARAVERLIADLPGMPHASAFGDHFTLTSEATGIELNFGAPDLTLIAVVLRSEGVEGCRRYAGELPHGLSLDDRRRDVERKVGRPAHSYGGRGTTPYESHYYDRGLLVRYASPAVRDPANAIRELTLCRPDDGPPPPPATAPASRPAAKGAAALAFRLVLDGDGGADQDVDVLADPQDPAGRRTLRVRREALLDGNDLEEVAPTFVDERTRELGIAIRLTPDGGRRMEVLSVMHRGRRVAIVLDGRVVVAPTVNPGITRDLVVSMTPGDPSLGTARLLSRMHAAAFALPAEPATRPADVPGA